ncbi:serine protease HtrA [Alkaliphilus crotonatoxidans]
MDMNNHKPMDMEEDDQQHTKELYNEPQEILQEPEPMKEPTAIEHTAPITLEKPNDRPVKKKSGIRYLILILVGALLGSGITMSVGYYYLPQILNSRGVPLGGLQQPITINPSADMSVYSAVAKKAMPSVVGITTITLQRDFFGTRRVPSVGTGVIVDARGYILTNSHVVGDGNAQELTVVLHDGEKIGAKVVWQDSDIDLAVIKVEGVDLPVAELGDSDSLEVGEIAVAIGNPLGLNFERTLTQGVISGLNRNIPVDNGNTIENLIQTDASINPGNSGGPLLNAKGQVIGINTAKIQSGEGLGFAIPINTARPIVEEIIEKGEFTRVVVGISGINVDVFESLTGTKLQADTGVYVAEVIADTAADRAGMMAGDIIIKLGDKEVGTMGSLQRELYQYRPGDQTSITVLRNGREEVLQITFE